MISVSYPAARRLQQYGLNVPLHVVHNGVTPSLFPRLSKADRDAMRRALGLTAPCIVGYQGTFHSSHAMGQLREMMLATADRSDIQWLFIGDGPGRVALQRTAASRVAALFLERQPPEEMGRLLALIDIAIVPHLPMGDAFYYCPLRILECAAAGCAVIASDQGDIPLLLKNGRAGLLVAAGDRLAWLAALKHLLNDEQRRKTLGRAGRRHVLMHFTWQDSARKVERVLTGVVSRLADTKDDAPKRGGAIVGSTGK